MLNTGRIFLTPGAEQAFMDSKDNPVPYILRHVTGDWGELSPEDQQANREALEDDARILSAYRTSKGTRLWVITEADRSSTTILLPEEY